MATDYLFDRWGQIANVSDLKPFRPLAPGPPVTFSGSGPLEVKWRGADLSIIFVATDTANAAPWEIGYEIPQFLSCNRVIPGQAVTEIPSLMLAYSEYDDYYGSAANNMYFERWGPIDAGPHTQANKAGDIYCPPAPVGAMTINNFTYLVQQGRDILILGIPVEGGSSVGIDMITPVDDGTPEGAPPDGLANMGPTVWLAGLSAMSGAGAELGLTDQVGHLISYGNFVDLAPRCYNAVKAYAAARSVKTMDIMWLCDNTGSMGGEQNNLKKTAVAVMENLIDDPYDVNFAYATFAEWSYDDSRKHAEGTADPANDADTGSYGSIGDTPYQVRLPFGPLTSERAAEFASAFYGGQGGDDTPETALEAVCRVLYGAVEFPNLNGDGSGVGARFVMSGDA